MANSGESPRYDDISMRHKRVVCSGCLSAWHVLRDVVNIQIIASEQLILLDKYEWFLLMLPSVGFCVHFVLSILLNYRPIGQNERGIKF